MRAPSRGLSKLTPCSVISARCSSDTICSHCRCRHMPCTPYPVGGRGAAAHGWTTVHGAMHLRYSQRTVCSANLAALYT